MIVKIYAYDGKEFSGKSYELLAKECTEYEETLRLKKQREEAERKDKEEKEKKLAQYRKVKIKEINDLLQRAVDTINEYEGKTGNKIIYDVVNCIDGSLVSVKETRNTLDFAWDNVIDEVFKAMHSKDICRVR